MKESISRPDAATGTTTAKINALKAMLKDVKKHLLPFTNVGVIVKPSDPYYGLSAIDAEMVCKEVLGRGKYDLYGAVRKDVLARGANDRYEASGMFAGVMIKG